MEIIKAGLEHVDDLAPVVDLYRQAIGAGTDPEGARGFLEQRYENNQAATFLAKDKASGEIMGFVNLYPCYTTIGLRPLWILNDLFVHAAYRRKGVAKALMDKAREFGKMMGAARLELKTQSINHSAQALYESLGWVRQDDAYHYNLDL